jgi:hypothetical protein
VQDMSPNIQFLLAPKVAHKRLKSRPSRGLVNISAMFYFVSTHSGLTFPLLTFSHLYMWCVAKCLVTPSSFSFSFASELPGYRL